MSLNGLYLFIPPAQRLMKGFSQSLPAALPQLERLCVYPNPGRGEPNISSEYSHCLSVTEQWTPMTLQLSLPCIPSSATVHSPPGSKQEVAQTDYHYLFSSAAHASKLSKHISLLRSFSVNSAVFSLYLCQYLLLGLCQIANIQISMRLMPGQIQRLVQTDQTASQVKSHYSSVLLNCHFSFDHNFPR